MARKKIPLIDQTDKEIESRANESGFLSGFVFFFILLIFTQNLLIGMIGALVIAYFSRQGQINSKTAGREKAREEKYQSLLPEQHNFTNYDPDYGKSDVLLYESKKKVNEWANALSLRQEHANHKITSLSFITSHEIRDLERFRSETKTGLLTKYQEKIEPHKDSLSAVDTSQPIEGIIQISNNIDIPSAAKITRSINMPVVISGNHARAAWNSGNANMALLQLAFGGIMALAGRQKAITQLTKSQGEVDNYMIEAQGVLDSLSASREHIRQFKDIISRLKTVLQQLIDKDAEIENIYIVGEQLKKLVNKPLATSDE